MRYEIKVEGGFTGIAKTYEGDIELKGETKEVLLNLFRTNFAQDNQNLRDVPRYHLKLTEGEEEHLAQFDETNLPLPIRQFISSISKNEN